MTDNESMMAKYSSSVPAARLLPGKTQSRDTIGGRATIRLLLSNYRLDSRGAQSGTKTLPAAGILIPTRDDLHSGEARLAASECTCGDVDAFDRNDGACNLNGCSQVFMPYPLHLSRNVRMLAKARRGC
jgi:hypothetical protein